MKVRKRPLTPPGLLTLDPSLLRVSPPSPPPRLPRTHLPPSLLSPAQVPEDFGPVRTVAEGRGDTLYVGTTRNSILQGSVHTGFSLLIQVSSPEPVPPRPTVSLLFPAPPTPLLSPFWFFLTSLPYPFSSDLANITYLPFTCSRSITPPLTRTPSGTSHDSAANRVTASTAEGPQDPAPAVLPPALLIRVVAFSVGKCPGRLSPRLHTPWAIYLPGLQLQGSGKTLLESSCFSSCSSDARSSLLVCQNLPTH